MSIYDLNIPTREKFLDIAAYDYANNIMHKSKHEFNSVDYFKIYTRWAKSCRHVGQFQSSR